MSIWRSLTRGARVLLHRGQADRDADDEMQHFFEQATVEAVARGTSPSDARREARLRFGHPPAIREEIRDGGWEHQLGTVMADVRFAVRSMRRRPAFAVVGVLTLALGIGSSTAIFSAVDPILFAPLPYRDAGRVVMLSDRGGDGAPLAVTYGTYREIAQRSRSFSALAVSDRWTPALIQMGQPERLTGELVTPDYFRALGVSPAVGRTFDANDDDLTGPRVVIVTDALARRRLGGAESAIGRSIVLNGDPFTVIGVMPATFENVPAPLAQVWTPRRFRANAPFESPEWGHHERMIGRLRSGVSFDQAQRELKAIGATPVPGFQRPPWAAMAGGLTLESLQAAVTRSVRPALLAILAAVALVLAIAAVNVANLLLARGAQRRNELALRATLGADRRRLIRQLLTESVLLAAVGGVVGLAFATLGVRVLIALAPANLPRVGVIHVDQPALIFALVLTGVVGVLVGVAPALRGARADLHSDMRSATRATANARTPLRRALVIAEVALALVVLIGAGLMLRSLSRLLRTAPGFNAAQVLTLQIEAVGHGYDNDTTRYQFFSRALDAVRQVPGVTDAAFTSQLPLSGDIDGYGYELASSPLNDPNAGERSALRYAVTPRWFQVMGIPLRRGRLPGQYDRPGSPETVVISESMARAEFSGHDPIGQRLRAGPEIGDTTRAWAVIVGVVGNVKQTSLALNADEAFYVPMGQWPWVDGVQSLVVRTSRDPETLAPAVEQAIWSVDRNQPISRVATMKQLLDQSEAQRHFVLTVFAGFGVAALLLAAIGIYGLVSGGVTERLNELGVRAALGASRGTIVLLVLREGVGLAVAGIVLGMIASAAATGLLRTLLFGVSRGDIATYGGVGALVLLVAVLASAIPAWRAARVDPAVTLRG